MAAAGLTSAQEQSLRSLCDRYHVEFDPTAFAPVFDLPEGWVAGWVGTFPKRHIYVGCSPEGDIHS